MEYNENNRPKCLADCRIDWMHYPVSGENGKVTLEDCSHLRNEWLEEDCACDANNLADTVKCDKYFAFDYDYETLRLFYKIPDYEGTPFDIWGLQKMFNDNWLLTPAFVKWMGKDSFGFIVYECWLESFLNGIHDPRMRVEILKFIVKHVNYIIPDTKKNELPRLKNTLDRYEAAYKLEKKMNMEKKQKIVIERNTYSNCTFNNCNNTENNYYGQASTTAQPQNVEPEQEEAKPAPKSPKDIWDVPQKGKYNQVREYIKERKSGDPKFKEFCLNHSLREICTYLTNEFGWDVDEHSLGASINRHRN